MIRISPTEMNISSWLFIWPLKNKLYTNETLMSKGSPKKMKSRLIIYLIVTLFLFSVSLPLASANGEINMVRIRL